MTETLKNSGEKSAENMGTTGPWDEKYQKNVPPFNSERKAKSEESEHIDLGTSVGQVKYLEKHLGNMKANLEQNLADDRFDSERVRQDLDEISYQEKILDSIHDEIANSGDLVEALTHKYDEAYRTWKQDMRAQGQNYKGGKSLQEMHYIENLCKTLAEQLTKNPKTAPYLSPSSIEKQTEDDIHKANDTITRKRNQLKNLSSKGNNIDEKGIAHIIIYDVNGHPVEETVDLNAIQEEINNAEIDSREAMAEKKVWGDLLRDDSSVFERKTSLHKITKKSDLKPGVTRYIDERTLQIEGLLAEAKTLEKSTQEYQKNEEVRKRLAKERSAARRILVKYFSENSRPIQRETHEETQKTHIDAVSTLDQMQTDITKYEKNLEAAEREKQRRIKLEKTHYGYIEGEGNMPQSVYAAEEVVLRIRVMISQKETDANLLYKIYKENGKKQMLSIREVQTTAAKIVQERDAKIATIDKELEKTEKKSERWKQLKQERAKVYRSAPDEAIKRVFELFS